MDNKITFLEKDISKWWKGIAACFIMIGHILPENTPMCFSYFFTGSIWVGLFFFYSGYGMQVALDKNDQYLKGFIKKKFKRIYLPFFIAESLYYFIVNIAIKCDHISFQDFICSIIGIRLANSVLWYVIELLIIDILFWCINILKLDKKIWIACYIVFVLAALKFDIGVWWYISTSCFVLGVYYKNVIRFFESIIKNRRGKYLSLFSFFLLYSILKFIPYFEFQIPISKSYLIVGITCVVVPLFVLVCIIISEKISILKNKAFLGQISYEIYLYHLLVAEVIWSCFGKTMTSIVIIAVLTVCVAYVMNLVDSKISC